MNDEIWHILLIEDDEEDYLLIVDQLEMIQRRGQRFRLEWVKTYEDGLARACLPGFDVALVDYDLGKQDGVDLIRVAVESGSGLAFVLCTGQGNYQVDMQAMQAGADDYLNKGELTPTLLERSIRYALSHKRGEVNLAAANESLARANTSLASANEALALANARLKASEERFKIAFSNAPVTVATIDRDLKYTWVYNPRITDEKQPVIGKGDEYYLPPESVDLLTEIKRGVLEREQGFSQEITLDTYQGQRTYILVLEPLRDASGAVSGMTAAALDISEQREMERKQMRATMQMEAQHHLLDQREMERQQIARDLHDGPIQDVVGLLFSVQEARSINNQPELDAILTQFNEALQKLSGNLRGVCNELRPPLLMRFGLERAIRAHAEEFSERNQQVKFTLDLAGKLPAMSESVKLSMYRIYQEALNNIMRHAHASRVMVRLRVVDDQIQMEVQDNGKGFRAPSDWVELARAGHLGLVGMRERAEAINGRWELFTRPGKGTRIRVTAPLS